MGEPDENLDDVDVDDVDDDDNTDDDKPDPMETMLEGLNKGFSALGNQLSSLGEKLDNVNKPAEKPDDDVDDNVSADDIELMSRTEFMDTMLNRVSNLVNKAVKPVEERVDNNDAKNITKFVQDEVNRLRGENPDFDEWKGDIKKVVKENPYLLPEQAFVLAKHKNPAKVKKLAKKYGKKSKGKDKQTPKMGGLLPSSGKVTSSESMTMKDAAEDAWAKTFGA